VGHGRREFQKRIGKDIASLDIRHHSYEEILKSPAWRTLYLSFYKDPMRSCLDFCPKSHSEKFNDKRFDGLNQSLTFGSSGKSLN
jgi:hypothetical protein